MKRTNVENDFPTLQIVHEVKPLPIDGFCAGNPRPLPVLSQPIRRPRGHLNSIIH